MALCNGWGHFYPITGDVGASFARPVWSADGRWLAAVRLPMGIPDPRPEVWVWDVATGELLQRFLVRRRRRGESAEVEALNC
jgi:hypothetical protein